MSKAAAAWLVVAAAIGAPASGPPDAVERAVVPALAPPDGRAVGVAPARSPDRGAGAARATAAGPLDGEEMARRALSQHWPRRSADEQAEFVALFTDLVERVYRARLGAHAGERVVVTREVVDGPYALVRTRVGDGRGQLPVDYRLHRREGRWRIYDVLIDRVSLVAHYRRQFDAIIRRESYAALADRMRRRHAPASAHLARP